MRSPSSGTVLGERYRLEEELKAGGMGAVYRAVDMRMNRPVAVKVVLAELVRESRFAERFKREAQIAGALAHPHIVQLTDFGESPDGSPFLVMELLEGETLGALLKREPKLPVPRVASMACQILDAVGEAHRAGIVHRDLKPPNVFLLNATGGAHVVKVLDFGIAKLMESEAYQRLTKTGQILGTPAWMAPEQARGEVIDARADIYAIGLLTYRCLAGRMPWDKRTLAELMVAVQREPPLPLTGLVPEVDPGLDAVVLRALHRQPEGRFANADAMRTALGPWTHASVPLDTAPASRTAYEPQASAQTVPSTEPLRMSSTSAATQLRGSSPGVAPTRQHEEPAPSPDRAFASAPGLAPSPAEAAPLPVSSRAPAHGRRWVMWLGGGALALGVLLVIAVGVGAALWLTGGESSEVEMAAPGSGSPPSTVAEDPKLRAPSQNAAAGSTAGCDDTCRYANDGACDDGRPGSTYDVCAPGTDCTDCGPQGTPIGPLQVGVCEDTCRFSGDGECDDGRPGSETSLCDTGSDCADCGPVVGP